MKKLFFYLKPNQNTERNNTNYTAQSGTPRIASAYLILIFYSDYEFQGTFAFYFCPVAQTYQNIITGGEKKKGIQICTYCNQSEN